MTSLKIICAFLALALAAAAYSLKVSVDQRVGLQAQVQELQASLQKEKTQEQKVQHELEHQKTQLEAQQKMDAEALKRQLQSKIEAYNKLQTLLESEAQQIQSLKQQPKKSPGEVLQGQMKMNQDRIRDLESNLKGYESGNKDLSKASRDALSNENARFKNDLALAKERVKEQEAILHKTQSDQKFWQKRNRDINQADNLKRIQTQLEEQNQQLAAFRQDVESLRLTDQQRSAAIKNQTTSERDGIQDSLGQIRAQLQAVRADLKHEQDQFSRLQKEDQEGSTRLHELETKYGQDYSQLQAMGEEIKKLRGAK
jgi:DNA repair exonuclease SbcCD ATPase subunit